MMVDSEALSYPYFLQQLEMSKPDKVGLEFRIGMVYSVLWAKKGLLNIDYGNLTTKTRRTI